MPSSFISKHALVHLLAKNAFALHKHHQSETKVLSPRLKLSPSNSHTPALLPCQEGDTTIWYCFFETYLFTVRFIRL